MFPSALSIYSAIPSTHWSEKYQRSLMFAKCDYRCHWSCARPYKQCQGHRCVLLISPDGVTIIICFTHMEMLHSIASVNYLSFLFWSERSILNSFRKLQLVSFIQNISEKNPKSFNFFFLFFFTDFVRKQLNLFFPQIISYANCSEVFLYILKL